MPEQLAFTRFLNAHFAGPADSLLAAVHVHVVRPDAPISNAVAMELIVVVLMLLYFVAVRITLSVDKPGAIQHSAEMVHEFVSEQSESIVGHGYEKFVGYLSTLALFILLMNLIGLVPGLESPTSNVVVPLGVALVTFMYYHYHGIRSNGAGVHQAVPWAGLVAFTADVPD